MAIGEASKYIAPDGFGQISERLSRLRHDIHGCLSVIVGATEILQMKPDPETAKKWLPRIAEQPERIIRLLREFSACYERHGTVMDQLSLLIPRLVQEDQKQSARQALSEEQAGVAQLRAELEAARRAAREAAMAQPFEEDTFRQHATCAAMIEAELCVLRARALAGLQPPLDKQQRDNLLRSCQD